MNNIVRRSRENKALAIIAFIIILLLIITMFNTGDREPRYDEQWYLHNTGENPGILEENDDFSNLLKGNDVNAERMWAYYQDIDKESRSSTIVAIIDTAVDFTHEDLKNCAWNNPYEVPNDGIDNDLNGYVDDVHGYDFTTTRNNEFEIPHATMCAGIIASSKNNKGILGVAFPSQVKIMSLKVLNFDGVDIYGTIEDTIQAIKYAEENGAKICNLSLDTRYNDAELSKTIKESKMLFTVSCGNGGENIDYQPRYPACYNYVNVITVANLSYNGMLNNTSGYGKKSVDIAAPGTTMLTTSVNNEYSVVTGSSFAAPVVAGVAAILYSVKEDVTAKEVKKCIINSARRNPLIEDKVDKGKTLDGYNALRLFVSTNKKEGGKQNER